uniref:exodeoxyribonuclease III n=1 Tax=Monopterus albus TaxID=43700 RepID=A0A3Q3IK72_MONAL
MLLPTFLIMITVASVNVNGLRSTSKMEGVFAMEAAHVLCLQETFWTDELVQQVRQRWYGELYTSCGTARSRGVAVLFRRGAVTDINCVHSDNAGRLLVVDFVYNNVSCRIINVYAPTEETQRKSFFQGLEVWCQPGCLLMGDWNIHLTTKDVGRNVKFTTDGSRPVLVNLIKNKELLDVWRQSRLDFHFDGLILPQNSEFLFIVIPQRRVLCFVLVSVCFLPQ